MKNENMNLTTKVSCVVTEALPLDLIRKVAGLERC